MILRELKETTFDYKYVKKILIDECSVYYPGFSAWYDLKVFAQQRPIYCLFTEDQLAGVAILKPTPFYLKICCFYIFPGHRKIGIGTMLLQFIVKRFKHLPIKGTLAEEVFVRSKSFWMNNGFKVCSKQPNRYRPNKTEYVIKKRNPS